MKTIRTLLFALPAMLRLAMLAGLLIGSSAWAQTITPTPDRGSGGITGRNASPAIVNPAPAAAKTAPGKTQHLDFPDQTPQGPSAV